MEKNMLLVGKTFEILLEAQDTKGNVVGEPRPGGEVDPATQLISIASGQRRRRLQAGNQDWHDGFLEREAAMKIDLPGPVGRHAAGHGNLGDIPIYADFRRT